MAEIELKHVTKIFEQGHSDVHAIKDVSLSIGKGDIFGIIGLSGAGKSTLVRCMNYLETPTEGQVFINGTDLGSLSSRELRKKRSEIGMIFQHFNLLMQKNVLDNVAFPLLLSGMKKKDARIKARDYLKTVGLSDKEKAYPAQLSGGQKQRVAIARALAASPGILLCDEATSALDPQTTASILSLLKEINETLGLTIVIITHQMSVVKDICKHVAVMEDGHVVEQGATEDIFQHPQTQVAKQFLKDVLSEKDVEFLEQARNYFASHKIQLEEIKNNVE